MSTVGSYGVPGYALHAAMPPCSATLRHAARPWRDLTPRHATEHVFTACFYGMRVCAHGKPRGHSVTAHRGGVCRSHMLREDVHMHTVKPYENAYA